MCEPLTLASLAIGALSQGASFMAQQEQAAEQNRLYEENRRNTLHAFEQNQASLSLRQRQEQDSAGAKKFDTELQGTRERATNVVAAGENGISGLTVDGLLADMYQAEDRAVGRIEQQTEWSLADIQAQKKAQKNQAISNINSVQRANPPSFLSLGLGIATAGVNAATQYQRQQRLNT